MRMKTSVFSSLQGDCKIILKSDMGDCKIILKSDILVSAFNL